MVVDAENGRLSVVGGGTAGGWWRACARRPEYIVGAGAANGARRPSARRSSREARYSAIASCCSLRVPLAKVEANYEAGSGLPACSGLPRRRAEVQILCRSNHGLRLIPTPEARGLLWEFAKFQPFYHLTYGWRMLCRSSSRERYVLIGVHQVYLFDVAVVGIDQEVAVKLLTDEYFKHHTSIQPFAVR
jgi:hypothetical protein